jgi:hypothetical protein
MPIHNKETLRLIGRAFAKIHALGEGLKSETLEELGQQFSKILDGSNQITFSNAAILDIKDKRPRPTSSQLYWGDEVKKEAIAQLIDKVMPSDQLSFTLAEAKEVFCKAEKEKEKMKQYLKDFLANVIGIKHLGNSSGSLLDDKDIPPSMIRDQLVIPSYTKRYLFADSSPEERCRVESNRKMVLLEAYALATGDTGYREPHTEYVAITREFEQLEKSGKNIEAIMIEHSAKLKRVKQLDELLEIGHRCAKTWIAFGELQQLETGKPLDFIICHLINDIFGEQFVQRYNAAKKACWQLQEEKGGEICAKLVGLPVTNPEAQKWLIKKVKDSTINIVFHVDKEDKKSYMVVQGLKLEHLLPLAKAMKLETPHIIHVNLGPVDDKMRRAFSEQLNALTHRAALLAAATAASPPPPATATAAAAASPPPLPPSHVKK